MTAAAGITGKEKKAVDAAGKEITIAAAETTGKEITTADVKAAGKEIMTVDAVTAEKETTTADAGQSVGNPVWIPGPLFPSLAEPAAAKAHRIMNKRR